MQCDVGVAAIYYFNPESHSRFVCTEVHRLSESIFYIHLSAGFDV